MTDSLLPLRRDRLARALCNWVLNHVATNWYRSTIEWSIRKGLSAGEQQQELELLQRLEAQFRRSTPTDGEWIDWEDVEATLRILDEVRGCAVKSLTSNSLGGC